MTVLGVPWALASFPLAFILAGLPHWIAAWVRLQSAVNEDEPGWVVLSTPVRRGSSEPFGEDRRGSEGSRHHSVQPMLKPPLDASGNMPREGSSSGSVSNETIRPSRPSAVNIAQMSSTNGAATQKITVISVEEHKLGIDKVI